MKKIISTLLAVLTIVMQITISFAAETTDAASSSEETWTCGQMMTVLFSQFRAAMTEPVPENLTQPANEGDIITFGNYPQTASGTDSTPIEWLVLKKEGRRALLLSKYALDCREYYGHYVDVTWANCDLRTWLNDENDGFIKTAFDDIEKNRILVTNVSNPDSYWGYDSNGEWFVNNTGKEITDLYRYAEGCGKTRDKVFLLSIDEVQSLLGDEKKHLSTRDDGFSSSNPDMQAACTDYANAQNALRSSNHSTASDEACCWWWLRSPGSTGFCAAVVSPGGNIDDYDVSYSRSAVRPALWVVMAS